MAPSMLSFLACLLLAMASGCQAQASASAFASVSPICLCRGCQGVSSSLPAWCALVLWDDVIQNDCLWLHTDLLGLQAVASGNTAEAQAQARAIANSGSASATACRCPCFGSHPPFGCISHSTGLKDSLQACNAAAERRSSLNQG